MNTEENPKNFYPELAKKWVNRFIDKIYELQADGSKLTVIAISRKMPRFLHWFESTCLKTDDDLSNKYKGAIKQCELTTEISIPFIFKKCEGQTCTKRKVLVVDDTVVMGNTLRSVCSDIETYCGVKPSVFTIVSREDYTPEQLGASEAEYSAVLRDDSQIVGWVDFVCKCNLSTSLPIDVEFPILYSDYRYDELKDVLEKVSKSFHGQFVCYKIDYDVYADNRVTRDYFSYNLIDLSQSLRDFRIDFTKIRVFHNDDQLKLSVFAPRFLRESELHSKDLFEQPLFREAWNLILSEVDQMEYNSRQFQTLAVCINYLYSLSTLNKLLEGKEIHLNIKHLDLSLIFGDEFAAKVLPLCRKILNNHVIEPLPLGLSDVPDMLIPDEFRNNYMNHRALAVTRSRDAVSEVNDDTIEQLTHSTLDGVFALSDYAKGLIGKSGSIYHKMHSIFFESFDSLGELFNSQKEGAKYREIINQWIDKQIDCGLVVPKYMQVTNGRREKFWRRFFMNSSAGL